MAAEQFHRPRISEMLADQLRDRILSGQLKDGDALPKQDELVEEFRVSRPALREALSILEVEGLISVRRGNVGGAVVRLPQASDAVHIVSVILRSQAVTLVDLGVALSYAEATCAAEAARRTDRLTAVVPALRAIHEEALTASREEPAYSRLARRFHEELVRSSGNATMILLDGLLESLWMAHEDRRSAYDFDEDTRRAGFEAHEEIIRGIEAGDVEAVMAVTKAHNDIRVREATGPGDEIIRPSTRPTTL